MKKILHISKYYYPFSGETEPIARDCVNMLKDGYEQKIVAFNDDSTVDGVDVIKCSCIVKIYSQLISLFYKRKLKSFLEDCLPNIIVFHYPNLFVVAILLKEIKRLSSKLIVYWHLDIVHQEYLKFLFTHQLKELLKYAAKVIAILPNYIEGSKWLQSVMDKCSVVHNCSNNDCMTIRLEIKEQVAEIKIVNYVKTVCVVVGNYIECRGFTYLIQASKLLNDRFQIYTTGTEDLSECLYKEAENNKKIIFTGSYDYKNHKICHLFRKGW